MRKLAALLGVFFALAAPASAVDRISWLYQLQPPDSWLNQQERFERLGFGEAIYDFFGRSATSTFSNLVVTPAGALNVQVGPPIGQAGSLYQYQQDDTTPFGGPGATALAADPTQIFVQGTMITNGPAIGPLTPPGTAGQSINFLVECQVQPTNQTSQTQNFVTSAGIISQSNVNRDRVDKVVCQSKAGTAATTGSQTTPAVDSGWLSVGVVAVANGTATITSGMVTASAQFPGFALATQTPAYTSVTATTGSFGTVNALTGFTSGDCVKVVGGALTDAGGACGTSTSISSITAGTNITSSGGSTPTIATVGNPTFSTSVTTPVVSAPSSSNLSLSSNAASSGFAQVNYNAANQTGGLRVYDGGTSNFSTITGTGATINGPLTAGAVTATSFTGSGSGITSATVPNAALVTPPLTALTAGTGISTGTGTTPSVGLAHGDYVDVANTQTIGGTKTFSSGISVPSMKIGTSATFFIQNNAGTYNPFQILPSNGVSIGGYADPGNGNLGVGGNVYASGSYNTTNAYGYVGPNFSVQTDGTNAYLNATKTGGSIYLNTPGGYMTYNGTTLAGQNISLTNNLLANGILEVGPNGGYNPPSAGDVLISRNAQGGVIVFGQGNGTFDWGVSNSGSFTANHSLYASAFYTSSRREWKSSIAALAFDPLALVDRVDVKQWRYRAKYGDPRELHYGPIANDTTSVLSGPKHDHYDVNAGSAVALAAIRELHAVVRRDEARIAALEREKHVATVRHPAWWYLLHPAAEL